MDGNTDAALKCLRMGMEALGTGDRSRALKLLSEACRLDPSLPLDDLLSATGGIESSRSYTEEQVAIVHQIREQRDYHEILGFEHDCTVGDVRRAYRKLSLKVRRPSRKSLWLSSASAKRRTGKGTIFVDLKSLTASSRHGFDDDDFDADEMLRSWTILSRSHPYEHKVVTPKRVSYFVKSEKYEEEYPFESSER